MRKRAFCAADLSERCPDEFMASVLLCFNKHNQSRTCSLAEECLSLFIGQICSVLFQHTKAGTVATSIFIYSSYNYVWTLCKIRYSVILKPSQSFSTKSETIRPKLFGLWTDRWLAGLITWFKTKNLQRLLTHLLNFQPSWWKIIKSIITTAQTVHNNTHSHYNRAQYKHRSAFWRRTWP